MRCERGINYVKFLDMQLRSYVGTNNQEYIEYMKRSLRGWEVEAQDMKQLLRYYHTFTSLVLRIEIFLPLS